MAYNTTSCSAARTTKIMPQLANVAHSSDPVEVHTSFCLDTSNDTFTCEGWARSDRRHSRRICHAVGLSWSNTLFVMRDHKENLYVHAIGPRHWRLMLPNLPTPIVTKVSFAETEQSQGSRDLMLSYLLNLANRRPEIGSGVTCGAYGMKSGNRRPIPVKLFRAIPDP